MASPLQDTAWLDEEQVSAWLSTQWEREVVPRLPADLDEQARRLQAFVRARKLHGRGIGWIDAHLLASTLAAGGRLWTADSHLARLAGELGIGYLSQSIRTEE